VVGADGSEPALASIRKGELDATIAQQPIAMMRKGVDLIAALQAGKKIQAFNAWPTQLITKGNITSDEVKQYGLWADEVAKASK
jgi:ribose transport system substrate-binding protein